MFKFDKVAEKIIAKVADEFDLEPKTVRTVVLTFYRWVKSRITKVNLAEVDVENTKTNIAIPGFGKLYVRKEDYVIKLMKRAYEREKEIRKYYSKTKAERAAERKAFHGQNLNDDLEKESEQLGDNSH